MTTYERINAYRVMWLFVFFDLPTSTKKQRKEAAKFRKELEKDGFTMMQFSVYVRYCSTQENMDVHIRRVRIILPDDGRVSIMAVTDKQYGKILNYQGKTEQRRPGMPQQLELF